MFSVIFYEFVISISTYIVAENIIDVYLTGNR